MQEKWTVSIFAGIRCTYYAVSCGKVVKLAAKHEKINHIKEFANIIWSRRSCKNCFNKWWRDWTNWFVGFIYLHTVFAITLNIFYRFTLSGFIYSYFNFTAQRSRREFFTMLSQCVNVQRGETDGQSHTHRLKCYLLTSTVCVSMLCPRDNTHRE